MTETKQAIQIDINSAICSQCHCAASLTNGKCQHCNPRTTAESSSFTWRDMPWIGFFIIAAIVGVIVAAVVFLPGKV